jgi:hypothetical protein
MIFKYMESSLHNKILIISSVTGILSVAVIIVGVIIDTFSTAVFGFLFAFSLLAVISSYALKYYGNKWIRLLTKYSMFLLPFSVIITSFIPFVSSIFPVMTTFTVLLAISTLIFLYVYYKAESVIAVITLIILMIIGIFMKRNHMFLSSVVISVSVFLLSAGSFMFGIRCLYLADRNRYFRNVTFAGSCALSVAFLGQLFKLQHWEFAGILIIIGFTSLILGTLYILLTLHSSGYIDWLPSFKKIFRKILIPWVFVFVLYVSRFMVPELNSLIFNPDPGKSVKMVSPYGFGMKDYTIEDKTESKSN